MVIRLEQGADVHMSQLTPLSLASVTSRLVLPFWYQLTRVVRDKGPLNGCVCVRENNVTVYDTGTCTLQLKTAFLASRRHLRSTDTRKLIVQRTPTVIDATAVV